MTQQQTKNPFLKLLPFAIIALALIAAVGMIKSKAKIQSRPTVITSPLVEVLEVKLETVQLSVKSQGNVEAKQKTKMVSEVSGRVIWISENFQNGALVSKGEALLQIETVNYEAALALANAELRKAELDLMEEEIRSQQAEADWQLAQKLKPQTNRHPTDLTLRKPHLIRALAAIEASKAQLKLAEKNLQRTHINASFQGIIDKKSVELGQYINSGSALATLLATNTAEVRLPLSPSDFKQLEKEGLNSAVTITIPNSEPGQSWSAIISRIEKNLDPVTHLRYAIASIQDPYKLNKQDSQALPLGTFVNALIEGATLEQVARIPRYALHNNTSLFIVDKSNVLHSRAIQFSKLDKNTLLVKQGLTEGEKVVLTRLALMTDNMQVSVSTQNVKQTGSH
ncbi:MAG: efflux RND transporter periplasmic adaptor subunit [Gammaproteobacteria bacterium]|nr:efflux RND transporter periplasmic adaptor subunit [Gammaproteobacteria bacterium]